MGKKIIKYIAKSFLIDDIIENSDELYRIFEEIDKLSPRLKSVKYRPPFSPVHAAFSSRINVVNSGERTVVCVMAALHEDDTELPVSIVVCTPLNEMSFIHSPTLELFVKEYITQVCRLFIGAGHGVLETIRLIQQTFNMNRADALINYNDTISKYFHDKKILLIEGGRK